MVLRVDSKACLGVKNQTRKAQLNQTQSLRVPRSESGRESGGERKMALAVKAFPFTVVSHVLGIVALILVLVWTIHFRGGLAWEAVNKNLIFNIHPFLMLLGYIFIGGEAIMSYKSLPLRKEVKKSIHLVLHGVALVLSIVGISAAFKNHNESGIANLYSLHSWIGIGVTVLYAIQWLYGLLVFFFPGGSVDLRRASIPWHVVVGLLVYILAVGNSALGFLEKLTFLESSGVDKFGSEAFLVNFTAIITVLFALFVILSVISQPSADEDDRGAYSAI